MAPLLPEDSPAGGVVEFFQGLDLRGRTGARPSTAGGQNVRVEVARHTGTSLTDLSEEEVNRVFLRRQREGVEETVSGGTDLAGQIADAIMARIREALDETFVDEILVGAIVAVLVGAVVYVLGQLFEVEVGGGS